MNYQHIYHYFLGVDLGRDRDHSAIAVLSLIEEPHGDFDRTHFWQPMRSVLRLGALKRIPLGTEYVKVVQLIRKAVNQLKARHPPLHPQPKIHIVLDSAGPGQVVKELIQSERMGINLIPVVLTGGQHFGETAGKRTVPRRDLVAHLRYLLETELLRVNKKLRHYDAFEREVAAVRPRSGQYEHDDLVIAASLAAWWATVIRPQLIANKKVG